MLSVSRKALKWLFAHMDLASPEQKAHLKKLEAETKRIGHHYGTEGEDDGVEIINDCSAKKAAGADQ